MAQADYLNPSDIEAEDTLKGKHLVFLLGEELYGIEIRHITEIIGIMPITVVPEMPRYVKGVANLRGKIIPVMDCRLRFNKAEIDYDDRTCIIVLETEGITLGLIVDSVSEVVLLSEEDISPPPELKKGGERYIRGIGKSAKNVILLLECSSLLLDDDNSSSTISTQD